jgi:hypothetical protein
LILCIVPLVLQATIFDCGSFDPFSLQQDGRTASEVDVGGSEIGKALVISLMVVMPDECINFDF